MRITSLPIALLVSLGLSFGALVACSASGRPEFAPPSEEPDAAPSSPPVFSGDASQPGLDVSVKGTVYAPNGSLPLSNVLVYLTHEKPEAIPEGAYCDECVKLPEGSFAVSAANGEFEIKTQVPKGTVYLVTQKGQFRRVRKMKVEEAGELEIDDDDTTLPAKTSASKGDTVPKMVVVKDSTDFDAIDDALKKLGITDFDVKTNHSILEDENALMGYHVVFIPCGSSTDSRSKDPGVQANLQKFVAGGGKLYVTDWSYEFVRQPFPGYVKWVGESASLGSATGSVWDAPAKANDEGLRDWLKETGDSTFEVIGNWTTIGNVQPQMGRNPKGEEVEITPKVWVTAQKGSVAAPATVSFENQCGRVMFSSYHTEGELGGSGSSDLMAQEKALLYILLEVSVCVGERPGVQ